MCERETGGDPGGGAVSLSIAIYLCLCPCWVLGVRERATGGGSWTGGVLSEH